MNIKTFKRKSVMLLSLAIVATVGTQVQAMQAPVMAKVQDAQRDAPIEKQAQKVQDAPEAQKESQADARVESHGVKQDKEAQAELQVEAQDVLDVATAWYIPGSVGRLYKNLSVRGQIIKQKQ